MSPLWRDEVELLLTPHRVALRHRRRGLRPRLAQARQAPVDAGGALHWAPALDALAALLAPVRARGADAVVVLSSHFVRYGLVPASDLLVTQEDELRFARHNFVRIHGPVAETWSLRTSPLPGGGTFASAIDEELVEGLRALLSANGLAARALRPALMASFNAARAQLPPAACRIVAVEPGLAVSALLRPEWQRVRSQRLGRPLEHDLARLIERERNLDEEAAAALPTCVLPLLALDTTGLPADVRTSGPLWTLAPEAAQGEVPEEAAA